MALAVVSIGAWSCGHKAPPLPPPNMAPQTTQDIKAHQRGLELLIDFAYPQVTVSGATLAGLEAVEIWELVQPVPEIVGEFSGAEAELAQEEVAEQDDELEDLDALEDSEDRPDRGEAGDEDERGELEQVELNEVVGSLEAELRADPREFVAAARVRASFRNPDLQSKIVGDRIFLSVPFDEPNPDAPEVYNLAVRTFSADGRPSQLSKHVVLIPEVPPATPVELTASGVADGVSLAWATGPEDLTGYRIYRREIRNPEFDQPLGKLDGAGQSYVDRTAAFGHNYIYAISAVAQNTPLIESSLSATAEIRYEDLFAPPSPKGLVILSGAEGVRLLWEEGRATDLAGYVVYRQERGTELERITPEPLSDNEFVDGTVSAGRAYTYVVRAIDRVGNLSPPSDSVDARP